LTSYPPRSGFFRVPVGGGVSTDIAAIGDPLIFPFTLGSYVTEVDNGALPYGGISSLGKPASYFNSSTALTADAGRSTLITTIGEGRQPLLGNSPTELYISVSTYVPATSTTPETYQVNQLAYPASDTRLCSLNFDLYFQRTNLLSTDGTTYADLGLVGQTPGTIRQYYPLAIGAGSIDHFYGSPCGSIAYNSVDTSPTGSLPPTYQPLPGEPAASGPILSSTTIDSITAVHQGKVYFSAHRLQPDGGTYTGIFQIDPASNNALTAIATSLTSLPGFTNTLSSCETPNNSFINLGGIAASDDKLVFHAYQNQTDCDTQVTTPISTLFAYNFATHAITTVLPLNGPTGVDSIVPNGLDVTSTSPAHLSKDGHLLLAFTTATDGTGPTATALYSLYLKQIQTSLSLTAATTAGSTILTAQLTPATTSTNTPTGSIHFYNGTTLLGDAPLDATGKATFSAPLTGQAISLKAVYDGDNNFMGADSNIITAPTVNVPDFTITASPSSATIKAGSSSDPIQFTITPTFGFNQTISFSCSGLPANATCTFTPSSVTPNGAPVTSTLIVRTNVAASTNTSAPKLRNTLGNTLGGTLLAGLLGSLFLPLLRRRKLPVSLLSALLLSASFLTLSGCGGKSSPPSTTTTTTATTTPAGTSNVTISAGVAGGGATHTTSVSIVIQ
jgi:hypothetical protein